MRPRARTTIVTALLAGMASLVVGIGGSPPPPGGKKRTPVDPGDDFFNPQIPEEESPLAPVTNTDGGAFGAESRPSVPKDAGVDGESDGGRDAGPPVKTYCEGPPKPLDLAVTEIMISARAGANDDGEWLEIS